ncbi:hypothetical protein GGR50DRAFT_585451 [Xylaria sp. CBS 124048]|nr:hypothetical protein GGR50DRAFT_585451 [Xylaria sp. CBS 124048]
MTMGGHLLEKASAQPLTMSKVGSGTRHITHLQSRLRKTLVKSPVLSNIILGPVLNKELASHRLTDADSTSTENAELARRWSSPCFSDLFPNGAVPLLRVWDQFSMSHFVNAGCLASADPWCQLSDVHSRRSTLSKYLSSGITEHRASPYISFTTSPARIKALAGRQDTLSNGYPQIVTVIDPNTRVQRLNLPLLNAKAEMDYYGIGDEHDKDVDYYQDEYLCLWQVTPAEIVGHWWWSELEKYPGDWYENIVLPRYKEFIAAGKKMDNSPSQTPNSPSQKPNSPSQIPNSPSQTPNSPSQTPNSPSQTPNSPSQTPNSPSQKPNSPSQTPNSPSQTPNSPTPYCPPSKASVEESSDTRSTNDEEDDDDGWSKNHGDDGDKHDDEWKYDELVNEFDDTE